jgi:hypothetical protein
VSQSEKPVHRELRVLPTPFSEAATELGETLDLTEEMLAAAAAVERTNSGETATAA